jgi:hypothetical protein
MKASAIPYQKVPKGKARYLLARIEEMRASARVQFQPYPSESPAEHAARCDAGVLAQLTGLLQHHAEPTAEPNDPMNQFPAGAIIEYRGAK